MATAKRKKEPIDLGVLEMAPISCTLEAIETPALGFFHVGGPSYPIPVQMTDDAAAMDVSAFLREGDSINGYTYSNHQVTKLPRLRGDTEASIYIEPGERILIPTGLYADIPEGYWLSLFSRSSTPLKQGLVLANSVGVIDSDYVNEIFVCLVNVSGVRALVRNGDRIAQVMLKKKEPVETYRMNRPAEPKTNRKGGFGSTGV